MAAPRKNALNQKNNISGKKRSGFVKRGDKKQRRASWRQNQKSSSKQRA